MLALVSCAAKHFEDGLIVMDPPTTPPYVVDYVRGEAHVCAGRLAAPGRPPQQLRARAAEQERGGNEGGGAADTDGHLSERC